MKMWVAVVVVTLVWIALASVLRGCARGSVDAAPDDRRHRPAADEFWSWAQREGGVRLGDDATLPPTHPLSHGADPRPGSERVR